jgi:hypothetical protein
VVVTASEASIGTSSSLVVGTTTVVDDAARVGAGGADSICAQLADRATGGVDTTLASGDCGVVSWVSWLAAAGVTICPGSTVEPVDVGAMVALGAMPRNTNGQICSLQKAEVTLHWHKWAAILPIDIGNDSR